MGVRLGVDFGTARTASALRGPDGRVQPLPPLPSAVFRTTELLTGADAERAGVRDPARLEPHPKRRIDDGTVWLGEREVAVIDLIAAVFGAVAAQARDVAGTSLAETVVTHPATWRQTRLRRLGEGARRAGLGDVRLVPEPVAAAAYSARVPGPDTPPGHCLVVYDLGAGTFDVSVVQCVGSGHEVVTSAGLPDFGGLDLDALVVSHARMLTAGAAEEWHRLDRPETPADHEARHALWHAARTAVETLSRHPAAGFRMPLTGAEIHLTRTEFERAARPQLDRTIALTRMVVRDAGLSPDEVGGVLLVGGASRLPLAGALLQADAGLTPTAFDRPDLVVAEGSLYVDPPALTAAPVRAPARVPTPAALAPESGTAVAVVPDLLDAGRPERPPRRPVPRPVRWAAAATVLVVGIAAGLWVTRPWSDAITGATYLATLDDGAASRGPVRSVAFSPDGTTLITGGDTRIPTLWNVAQRRRLKTFGTRYNLPVSGVAFSPDGHTVAFVGGPLQMWDVSTGAPRGGPDSGQAVGVTAVTFSSTNRIATGDTGGSVQLWDTRQLRDARSGPAASTRIEVYRNGDVFDVAFSPDGARLATAGGDGVVHLFDVATGRRDGAVLAGHDGAVLGVAFSPDGRTLASASSDGTVRLWDVAARTALGSPLTGHHESVYEVAFSPDGGTLASAGEDHTARLWDVARRTQLQALSGHRAAVFDVAFSPDGRLLATASGDRTTRLWELRH